MTNSTALLRRRLLALDCCTLSDALDALGLEGTATGFSQLAGKGRIAGVATTLKVGIGDSPPGPRRHLGTTAIEASDPNSLIVVEQRSGINAGCWGGLLTLAAQARGITGAVIDGPIRDIDEAADHCWPVFGHTLTCRTARGRVVELGTNVPVSIGGVRVSPGDFVAADRSGVVVIAPENVEKVLETAEDIAAKEADMARALRANVAPSDVMAGNYETLLENDHG